MIERKVQRFSISSSLHFLPHTCIALSIINLLSQRGTFVTTDEPILTHHSHATSAFLVKAHAWCCTLYGFGQMYNDMYDYFY
jgi:hypothetical protein